MDPKTVLDFWFSERVQRLCFEKDEAFDAEIRDRFGAAVAQAQAGGFEDWRATPEGALALVILLDQMPRNIHRGSPQAFAGDARARGRARDHRRRLRSRLQLRAEALHLPALRA